MAPFDIGFMETTYSAEENATSITICIGVTSDQPVTSEEELVQILTSTQSAADEGNDYILQTTNLTFVAGTNFSTPPQCIAVDIIDDEIVENNEIFTLSLELGVGTANPESTAVTIMDNDSK